MENEFNQALNKKFTNPAKFAVEIENLVKKEKLNYLKSKIKQHCKTLHKSKFFWFCVIYYIVVLIMYKIY